MGEYGAMRVHFKNMPENYTGEEMILAVVCRAAREGIKLKELTVGVEVYDKLKVDLSYTNFSVGECFIMGPYGQVKILLAKD